ncbi:MAG: class I SAM-dependent methyltransferase [Phyllobacterium sp.]
MSVNPKIALSKIAVARRQYLARHVASFGSIAELGAFDNPVFSSDLDDDVKYIDWFSKEELIDMHKNNPRRNFARAVDVDYVIKDHLFARHISARFDTISGSHVIEHIADVISWLNQLESLLSPGGRLFLAIPDRRYTFDFYRKESTAVEMVRASVDRLQRPDTWQLFDHFYYHQKVDCQAIWSGQAPSKFSPRFDLDDALQRAERASSTYTDAHCWVFTPESFKRAMDDLFVGGFTKLSVHHVEPTMKNENEFWAIMRK